MTRFELKPLEPTNWYKLICLAIVFYAAGVLMNVYMFRNPVQLAFLSAIVFFLFPIGMGLYNDNRRKKFAGQFVSFDETTVSFNTGTKDQFIPVSAITSVNVKFDEIDLILNDGRKHLIILDNFEVADRQSIKNYFEHLVPQA